MAGQPGVFDADERLRAVVDFELFRPALEAALARADRSRGGRPPYDAVLMFRILVLQTLYTLSDEQTEYQLRDRLSVLVVDDTALLKKGKRSVGVAAQYCGERRGPVSAKRETAVCLLAKRSAGADRPAAVPAERLDGCDPARCARAGVPEAARLALKKLEMIALREIDRVIAAGVRPHRGHPPASPCRGLYSAVQSP
jgi:hypothetical protein